jgi:hypothetical protein
LIAPGDVDERSIKDVKADDLKGPILPVCNSCDQEGHGMSDIVSIPYLAIDNFWLTSTRPNVRGLVCELYPKRGFPRNLRKPLVHSDWCAGSGLDYYQAIVWLLSVPYKWLRLLAFFYESLGLILHCWRVGISLSTAIYSPVPFAIKNAFHTCGNHGLRLICRWDVSFDNELCTGQNKTYDGRENPTSRFCILNTGVLPYLNSISYGTL